MALFLLILRNSAAIAHEARPCYLEVTETSRGQYAVLWRTPVLAGMHLPVKLQLPDDVRDLKDPTVEELTDSFIERRWITSGVNGLAGQRIAFPGLQVTITDVLGECLKSCVLSHTLPKEREYGDQERDFRRVAEG